MRMHGFFSHLANHIPDKKHSADARASSFLNILELIPQLMQPPLMLFVENVVGFETSDTHEKMLEILEETCFVIQEFILSPLQALTDVVDKLAEMLTRMDDLIEHPHVRQDKRTTDIIKMVDLMIDSIELYVFRVENKHTVRAYLLRSKLRLAIKNLTTKIREFVNSQRRDGSSSVSSESKRPYKVQDLSELFVKDFIGREDDINNLVSYLVDHEEEEFRVISIYGMGGLGKTTLARKVNKHKKVLEHFQRFAFVCVSEQCQEKEVLKHILQQLLLKEEKDMKGMTDADVTESLQRVLGEKKCFLVVDDIWSVDDWEKLNCGLLSGGRGKILLTTRIKDVAEKGFCYPLKCLSKDESWELFRSRLFRFQDGEEKKMEELGREMVSWCRGNPFAILVLRGVLVTKGSLREWLRFYETRKSEGDPVYKQFKDEVGNELFYSYKELPYPLKPCFLYMASFAENKEIDVEMLYMLWDVEGMILSKDKKEGETMMDVGERYLEELVGRCMIEAELDDNMVNPNIRGRRYKLCRLHDLMRELCLSIVKKENFLKVHDYRGRNDNMVKLPGSFSVNDTLVPPRQVLYFSRRDYKLINEDHKHKGTRYLRSIIFNGGFVEKPSTLKKMTLVRVLSFYRMKIESKAVTHELIHLRYLSLNGCHMKYFPSFNFNLYLQTLDMQIMGDGSIRTIPNDALKKLKRLKHLFLPHKSFYMVTPKFSKLRLDGLTKLETLVNVDSSTCEMRDVTQLTCLKKLEMGFRIASEVDGEEMKEFIKKVNLDQLRHLLLAVDLFYIPETEIYWDVLKVQLPKIYVESLQKLDVFGMRAGKLLPEFSNYSRLNSLMLGDFELEEDPMPILEKLSNLKYLGLIMGKLLKGTEMTCSATGFPQLTSLYFVYVENWEKWSIEEGTMPNLQSVTICGCLKLWELPDGLKFTSSLVNLSIRLMPDEFKMRLIKDAGGEGPDFYKIRHVPIVEIV